MDICQTLVMCSHLNGSSTQEHWTQALPLIIYNLYELIYTQIYTGKNSCCLPVLFRLSKLRKSRIKQGLRTLEIPDYLYPNLKPIELYCGFCSTVVYFSFLFMRILLLYTKLLLYKSFSVQSYEQFSFFFFFFSF